MLLEESEIRERIDSPLNLLNRLRSATRSQSPCLPPSSDEIIGDLQEKIAFGSVKAKATKIMSEALDELTLRLPEVTKPKELASIAETMNKVVSAHNAGNNGNGDIKIGQVIIYAPQVQSEDKYDVIDVSKVE
jgi:hypothetical protein